MAPGEEARRVTDDPTDARTGAGPADADGPTLIAMLRSLTGNLRLLAEAEVELRKSQAAFVAGHAKRIALMAVLALFFLFFLLMALVVGLLLALNPLLGGWGAMGVVALALLVLTGACVLAVVRGTKALVRGLKGERP